MIESKLLEVPLSAMPRERLERYGAKVLETHELLAILLRTGSKGFKRPAAGGCCLKYLRGLAFVEDGESG